MRIGVAMSGGMDSTASAFILKKQGYDVAGLHMNLHRYSEVSWIQARKAAREAGVPIHLVDLSTEFREIVVEPFVEAYSKGLTPSPCLICNRTIKMTLLFELGRSFGCTKIATGHYARVMQQSGRAVLMKGVDAAKDQSYFLSMLTPEMLHRTLLPLGEFTKDDTRRFLSREGLSVWESDESQELCFVPDGKYREFLLREGVKSRPGSIVDSTGQCLGKHQGIIGYTVGQRRGLGISAQEPLYVIRIESGTDNIVVGPREQTFVSMLRVENFNLLWPLELIGGEEYQIKVRSTSKPVGCKLEEISGNTLELRFNEPQSGVAPGQAAVLYTGDYVVGGGWIGL
ncbi:MAG: tRNA 2-thiouridine(34) synthase MnmA [Deltaproteobacteria bacterium]|nr:tRNA 2-thiouridine(34) synthase MnmA [Deltaproteobacteria bacterium]